MSHTLSNTLPTMVSAVDALRRQVAAARGQGKTIALVPTMGALHAGHLSLVEAASRGCDFTVVTIFVNPTQFGPGEDFGRYPRTLEHDLELLSRHRVDLVFTPDVEVMYPPGHVTFVEPGGPALRLEGEFRPGHFRGVATVVLKLFNLVQPDRAYFGRKDYQQSLVVRRMVGDFDLPIRIEMCATVREADGLALSSRNRYLSPDERQRALAISQSLRMARQWVAEGIVAAPVLLTRMRELLDSAGIKLDYVALADPDTLEPMAVVDRPTVALVAGRVGTTRLIDNETIR